MNKVNTTRRMHWNCDISSLLSAQCSSIQFHSIPFNSILFDSISTQPGHLCVPRSGKTPSDVSRTSWCFYNEVHVACISLSQIKMLIPDKGQQPLAAQLVGWVGRCVRLNVSLKTRKNGKRQRTFPGLVNSFRRVMSANNLESLLLIYSLVCAWGGRSPNVMRVCVEDD